MKKIFDWIIDKWLAGFITASFFFMLKLYVDLPSESKHNFFSFNWVTDLLNTQIAFSTAAVIIILIILLTRIEKAYLKQKRKDSNKSSLNAPKSEFGEYRKDTFGIHRTNWSWNYEWQPYKQKFVISDLKPLCKQCEIPMEVIEYYGSDFAECHKCRLEGREHQFRLTEQISDIEKEIIRRIQNKEMK